MFSDLYVEDLAFSRSRLMIRHIITVCLNNVVVLLILSIFSNCLPSLTYYVSSCFFRIIPFTVPVINFTVVRSAYKTQLIIEEEDLAPPPLPSSLSVSSTGDTQEDWERKTVCCRDRVVWGRSQIVRHKEKKDCSSIIHSILSDNAIMQDFSVTLTSTVSFLLPCSHWLQYKTSWL